VLVPSARRGVVPLNVVAAERTLSLQAFFIRGPDRDHAAVYAHLLRKNADLRGWRFALDGHGDVYLLAEAPVEDLTSDALDGLLGAFATYVDEMFDGVMRLGFDVGARSA
jgi:hypothetical protein